MENNQLIKDEMSDRIVEVAERIVMDLGEVTVRDILRELNITNRVFYNRFHNIEEVLEVVYSNTIVKVREGLLSEYDGIQDFLDYVVDSVSETLIASYDIKKKFNQYIFEYDSLSKINYEWYMGRIRSLFAYAKANELIRSDIDSEALGYAIWCFCRGYNADAVMRMPKDEAVKNFKYSFRILLDGLR